jgi:formate dehydrogenase gamma subunit
VPESLAHLEPAMSNDDCLQCHGLNDLTKTNSNGQVISMFMDFEKFKTSVHATNSCSHCHSDLKATHPDDEIPALPVNCGACHEKQAHSYDVSVHAHALKEGRAGVASCKDCHGHHDVVSPELPESPLHWSKISATCGECHTDVAMEVDASVHGLALARGSRDAPTCTDCHSEHNTKDLKHMHPVKVAEQTCAQCHASERINTRYRLPGNRMSSFMESYHGLAAQFGSTKAANCASCHGVHGILNSGDPKSMIHPANLVSTCGKCHPGATENFALSRIHTGEVNAGGDGDIGSFLNLWVRRIYLVLIFGTVGALSLHNGLAWLRKALAYRKLPGRTVVRMDKNQRIQHILLASSFIILAISGFALRYPDTGLSWLMGSEEVRRWIHRVAGVVMIALGLYHIFYLAARREGRKLFKDMLPKVQDVKDVAVNARYLATGRGQKARFGRFGYPEKFEYWAVVWGTILMGATGLLIWFALDATRLMPRWVIDVSTTIHFYEAILACLAIVVWHFYHVIFEPGVYPMNWAWWDGKVSEHHMQEEHPLEVGQNGPHRSTGSNGAPDQHGNAHAGSDPVNGDPVRTEHAQSRSNTPAAGEPKPRERP